MARDGPARRPGRAGPKVPGLTPSLSAASRAIRCMATAAGKLACEAEGASCWRHWPQRYPNGGRVLEIGTGVGAGLAWLVHGLGARRNVEVVMAGPWPLDPDRPAPSGHSRVHLAQLATAEPAKRSLTAYDN